MSFLSSSLLILISAIAGWCIAALFIHFFFRPRLLKKWLGISFTGILPALLPIIAGKLAAAFEQELLEDKIEQRIDDPALMMQLRPVIENHIDLFLSDKLKETFPLLANFMGEKTMAKLKEALLCEVEMIVPSIFNDYTRNFLNVNQPALMIEKKLKNIDGAIIEKFVKNKASGQLMYIKIMGALLGIVTGILQLLIIKLTH